MTGLFRRLARQVVGPEPARVHSMARLPFAAPPAMATAEQTTGLAEPQTPAAIPADFTRPDAPPAPVQPAREAPEHHSPQAAGITNEAQRPRQALPERRKRPPARRTAVSAEAVRVPPPLLSEPQRTAPAESGAYETAAPAPAVSVCEDANAPNVEAGAFSLPPPVVPSAAPAPEARSLRRVNGVPAAASGKSQTIRADGTAAVRPDEPAEVHVHIGRIEVTALQEPPPTRRQPRPGIQPMSLDDYLKRLERGRS